MDNTNKDLNLIRKQLGTLRKACFGLTALVAVGPALTYGLLSNASAKPQEVIRAERLEIVESDGTLAFTMANSQRPDGVYIDGEKLFSDGEQRRIGTPSVTFYDGKGDEVGGMMMGTGTQENDGYLAHRLLALDSYKQDQTVVLSHRQTEKGTRAGLDVSDRPKASLVDGIKALGLKPGESSFEDFRSAANGMTPSEKVALDKSFGGAPRVFVGSDFGEAKLELADGKGTPRFVVSVPEKGPVSMKVFDEHGKEQSLSSLIDQQR